MTWTGHIYMWTYVAHVRNKSIFKTPKLPQVTPIKKKIKSPVLPSPQTRVITQVKQTGLYSKYKNRPKKSNPGFGLGFFPPTGSFSLPGIVSLLGCQALLFWKLDHRAQHNKIKQENSAKSLKSTSMVWFCSICTAVINEELRPR